MPKNANQNKKYVKFTNGHFFWDTLYKKRIDTVPKVKLLNNYKLKVTSSM